MLMLMLMWLPLRPLSLLLARGNEMNEELVCRVGEKKEVLKLKRASEWSCSDWTLGDQNRLE